MGVFCTRSSGESFFSDNKMYRKREGEERKDTDEDGGAFVYIFRKKSINRSLRMIQKHQLNRLYSCRQAVMRSLVLYCRSSSAMPFSFP